MKILLTGATGLIGQGLAKLLKQRGHHLLVLTRNAQRAQERLQGVALTVEWPNPKFTPPPFQALEGLDSVIHLAGESVAEKFWTKTQKQELRESRVLVTRQLVQGLRHVGPPLKRFIGASAIGFYGNRGAELLREEAPMGEGFLGELCRDWETEIFQASNLCASVAAVRVGIVLTPEGGALAKMLKPFRLGIGAVLGDGKQWMSWIHYQDILRLLAYALEHPELTGAINGVAPHPVTNAEFSQTLSAALAKPLWLKTPAAVLKLGLGEMAQIVLNSQRCSAEKALAAGFQFEYPELKETFQHLFGPISR